MILIVSGVGRGTSATLRPRATSNRDAGGTSRVSRSSRESLCRAMSTSMARRCVLDEAAGHVVDRFELLEISLRTTFSGSPSILYGSTSTVSV
jgi:hypothetical protein